MLEVFLCLALQDSIDDSIRALGDPDPVLRDLAVERLIRAGAAALDRLEPLANDPDPERRARVHQVLREIGSPVALVADLRSDRIAGNAEEARRKLLRTMETDADRVVYHLLPLLDGRDPQAAFYAAWLLQRGGRGERILEAQPEFHEWAVRAFYTPEVEPMMWVAGHVLLRLDASRPADEVDAAYARGLAGVRPAAVVEPAEWYARLAGEIGVRNLLRDGFPEPLWDKLLENWRDDSTWDNAERVDSIVGSFPQAATAHIEPLLGSEDPQQRVRAALFMIEMEPADPSNRLIEAAVESLDRRRGWDYQWGASTGAYLVRVGERALPAMDAFVACEDLAPQDRLEGLQLRLAIDPHLPLDRIAWVWANLRSDNERDNARRAAGALVQIETPLGPLLTPWMGDADPQVAAAAFAILSRRGEVTVPPASVLDAIERACRWSWRTIDEEVILTAAAERLGESFEPLADRVTRSGYGNGIGNLASLRRHVARGCDCLSPTER